MPKLTGPRSPSCPGRRKKPSPAPRTNDIPGGDKRLRLWLGASPPVRQLTPPLRGHLSPYQPRTPPATPPTRQWARGGRDHPPAKRMGKRGNLPDTTRG